MGNESSNSSSSASFETCNNSTAMNGVCYMAGWDQANGTSGHSPTYDGVQAGICSMNAQTNACYGQGAKDASGPSIFRNDCSGQMLAKL